MNNSRNKDITANETLKNWQGFDKGEPSLKVIEALLYTDAWILGGNTKFGPHTFVNTFSRKDPHNRNVLQPAIALRIEVHLQNQAPTFPMKDNFDHYHGGDQVDEMAAIASLGLGIRLRAGPTNREFTNDGDRYGTPIQYDWKSVPVLPLQVSSRQIPQLQRKCYLATLEVFEGFSKRTIVESNAFIKAARLYQQAMWVCDADPALGWLLLVSAIEAVALVSAADEATPRERLEASLPKVLRLLEESPCADLIDQIAEYLAKYTGVTKKFIDFVVKFSPEPPTKRPIEFARFSFEKKDIKKAAKIIYDHRSASLHSGIAFPLPMCAVPTVLNIDGKMDATFEEIPGGLAQSAYGATWRNQKTPMLLHTFEYIVRSALLGWWKSLSH